MRIAQPIENNRSFALQVKKLTCTRGDRRLVKNFCLSLRSGEIIQIVGHNGVGKTTLLKSLVGIVPLECGEVLWQGQPIQRDRLRYYKNIYYLDHQIGVKSELTVIENILLDVRMERKKDWYSVLVKFGLANRQNTPARQLSQGQRQRFY